MQVLFEQENIIAIQLYNYFSSITVVSLNFQRMIIKACKSRDEMHVAKEKFIRLRISTSEQVKYLLNKSKRYILTLHHTKPNK